MVSKKNSIQILQNNDETENIIEELPKRGRPRKYPRKEVDPNKQTDPKHYRLRTIKNEPKQVKITNETTGEVTIYRSIYHAMNETKRSWNYYRVRDGKTIDGIKIEIIRQ